MRRRTGNIQDRGTSFRVRYYDANGIRQNETYSTREEAEQQRAIRMGELAKGLPVSSKPNTVLFGELADDVLIDYEVNGYSSEVHAELRFRLHLVPVFGKKRACQIITAQIKKYIVDRQAEGAATGTIARELQLMRHTFNLAIEGRKLMHMPHVPMLRETNVRTGFFTRAEVDRLARNLKAPLDSMVWFAFWTGWRLGEIRGLLWRNVDFLKGEIRLDPGTTKNGEGRVFPMTVELRALLKNITRTRSNKTIVPALRVPRNQVAAPANRVSPYVFGIDGKPIGEFRKTWRTACHKTGLPFVVDKQGHLVRCLRTFHDLRRSFAREMDKMRVRQGAVMELGGWKTDSVYRRYNIVSEEDLRDAIQTVNRSKRAGNGARNSFTKRKT